MTFALFVGPGNIIFPQWLAYRRVKRLDSSIWFLITAVGLPVLTVVALAKVGGGVGKPQHPQLAKWLAFCWQQCVIWPLARYLRPRVPRQSPSESRGCATDRDSAMPLFIWHGLLRYLVIRISLYRANCWYRG